MKDPYEADHRKGKALRKLHPREKLGEWRPARGRTPVVDQVKASDHDRLPELVPLRHQRMAESPFVFYRATAGIMARDLATRHPSPITVQAIGDCHLLNFGGFATPERALVFDVNDFDETHPAPWDWDVKRLAASFALAARSLGLSDAKATDVVMTMAATYRDKVREFAQLPMLDLWYLKFDLPSLSANAKSARAAQYLDKAIATSERSTHEQVLYKITQRVLGRFEIKDQPPLVYHPHDLRKHRSELMLQRFMDEYRLTLQADRRQLFDGFRVADLALKVVGVGSVGTRCYVALLLNRRNEPLFLQIKEARVSALAPYVPRKQYAHQGQRVVEGQRLVQAASDLFLGWSTGPAGRHFYFRQLRDRKISVEVGKFDRELLTAYARLCGLVLARAHVKTGNGALLAGYLGQSDAIPEAMSTFALKYADRTERDHAAFVRAIKAHRVKASGKPPRTA